MIIPIFASFNRDGIIYLINNTQAIRKCIEDTRKADNVIFYYENSDKYELIKSTYSRELGRLEKLGRSSELPEVYIIDKQGILRKIKE